MQALTKRAGHQKEKTMAFSSMIKAGVGVHNDYCASSAYTTTTFDHFSLCICKHVPLFNVKEGTPHYTLVSIRINHLVRLFH